MAKNRAILLTHGVNLVEKLTAIVKINSLVLSILNTLPQSMTMGEIKSAVARVNTRLDHVNVTSTGDFNDPQLVEKAVLSLIASGRVCSPDGCRYIAKRHCPKFRLLDADWQW